MNIRFNQLADNSVPDIKLSREILYQRHRLSHMQIDKYLGEQQHDLLLEEKINQMRQVALFLEITTALNKADIWFVAYKGPLLSHRIYNDATCRRFKDFDFLVKPAAIEQTIGILRQLGYCSKTFEWPGPGNQQNTVLSAINQFVLYNPTLGTMVEVHWRLFNYPVTGFEHM